MSSASHTAALRETAPAQPTLGGKPLRWSRGWTLLVVVWLVAGGSLLAVRLQMGHLSAWTPREAAAVAAVRAFKPDGVHTCDRLLDGLARAMGRHGDGGSAPVWYAFERPWERRVYVVWECGDETALVFVVRSTGVVPDDRTRVILRALADPAPPD